MEEERIFNEIEKESEVVDTGFKGEGKIYRIIKESDYQKIKKEILAVYFEDG